MKIKSSELKDQALDWAVAKYEGQFECSPHTGDPLNFLRLRKADYRKTGVLFSSTDPAQAYPIIEREKITTIYNGEDGIWNASHPAIRPVKKGWKSGPTPLVAAMRAFVASRLGDEVEIPDELL